MAEESARKDELVRAEELAQKAKDEEAAKCVLRAVPAAARSPHRRSAKPAKKK